MTITFKGKIGIKDNQKFNLVDRERLERILPKTAAILPDSDFLIHYWPFKCRLFYVEFATTNPQSVYRILSNEGFRLIESKLEREK